MLILRVIIISILGASPLVAEEHAPVIGAQRTLHHAAPLPVDGEGDYGFAGTLKEQRATKTPAPALMAPDEDLLAYEEEEALIEAEAALAVDAAAEPTVVID